MKTSVGVFFYSGPNSCLIAAQVCSGTCVTRRRSILLCVVSDNLPNERRLEYLASKILFKSLRIQVTLSLQYELAMISQKSNFCAHVFSPTQYCTPFLR